MTVVPSTLFARVTAPASASLLFPVGPMQRPACLPMRFHAITPASGGIGAAWRQTCILCAMIAAVCFGWAAHPMWTLSTLLAPGHRTSLRRRSKALNLAAFPAGALHAVGCRVSIPFTSNSRCLLLPNCLLRRSTGSWGPRCSCPTPSSPPPPTPTSTCRTTSSTSCPACLRKSPHSRRVFAWCRLCRCALVHLPFCYMHVNDAPICSQKAAEPARRGMGTGRASLAFFFGAWRSCCTAGLSCRLLHA